MWHHMYCAECRHILVRLAIAWLRHRQLAESLLHKACVRLTLQLNSVVSRQGLCSQKHADLVHWRLPGSGGEPVRLPRPLLEGRVLSVSTGPWRPHVPMCNCFVVSADRVLGGEAEH